MDMATLTGADLRELLADLAENPSGIRSLSVVIDNGLKYKINDDYWSLPMGEVRKIP